MCLGLVASSIIALVINTHYTGKLIQVGFLTQMRDIAPTLIFSLLMGAAVYGVISFLPPSPILQLCVGVLVGACVYALIAWLTGSKDLKELRSFIPTKKIKFKK